MLTLIFVVLQADIIIWDFDTLQMMHRLKLHKVLIQSLSFSFDEKYLASLGGQDDNTLVIWDVSTRLTLRMLQECLHSCFHGLAAIFKPGFRSRDCQAQVVSELKQCRVANRNSLQLIQSIIIFCPRRATDLNFICYFRLKVARRSSATLSA